MTLRPLLSTALFAALAALPDDERVWVPQMENVWFRPLLLNTVTGSWFNLLSSMFMHGGWFHIIGNVWFLWVFGDNVEDAMGTPRFLLFYLLSGLAAAGARPEVTRTQLAGFIFPSQPGSHVNQTPGKQFNVESHMARLHVDRGIGGVRRVGKDHQRAVADGPHDTPGVLLAAAADDLEAAGDAGLAHGQGDRVTLVLVQAEPVEPQGPAGSSVLT